MHSLLLFLTECMLSGIIDMGIGKKRLQREKSGKTLLLFIYFFLFISAGFSQPSKKIVVSQDGTGNFTTIQDAFDNIPVGNRVPVTVYVKKGVYRERLVLDTRKDYVSLIGEDKSSTVIVYNNHAGLRLPDGDTVNTWSSATFFVYANNFHAENITIRNDAGFSAGQAVAVFVYGTRASFFNCNLTGYQDVLFCNGAGSLQYYQDCYIEGTTDFIFGPATAVFKNCQLHSKKNSHVTAASTPREIPFGFVFIGCKLTADSNINKVSLGRPWQPYANVAYIHCEIGNHIIPEGWNNWKNPDNEKTARYAEFENTGLGSATNLRVGWCRQLSKTEAEQYTIGNILGTWAKEVLKK